MDDDLNCLAWTVFLPEWCVCIVHLKSGNIRVDFDAAICSRTTTCREV